jgi:hypothetical protein
VIGFNAIGQGAIGEIASGDDVLIFAPSIDVTVTAAAPAANTIVTVPSNSVTVALGTAPFVTAGKSVLPPAVPFPFKRSRRYPRHALCDRHVRHDQQR